MTGLVRSQTSVIVTNTIKASRVTLRNRSHALEFGKGEINQNLSIRVPEDALTEFLTQEEKHGTEKRKQVTAL